MNETVSSILGGVFRSILATIPSIIKVTLIFGFFHYFGWPAATSLFIFFLFNSLFAIERAIYDVETELKDGVKLWSNISVSRRRI